MKRMASFSFLLPFKFNDGSKIPADLFVGVREALTDRFGGVTFQENPDNPIKGLWVSPSSGRVVSDDLMLFTVWAENVNEARDYFEDYKGELLKKFRQDEIKIIEQTIETF